MLGGMLLKTFGVPVPKRGRTGSWGHRGMDTGMLFMCRVRSAFFDFACFPTPQGLYERLWDKRLCSLCTF